MKSAICKFGLRYGLLALAMVAMTVTTYIPAQARVIIKEKTRYYNVTGKNGPELMRSITRRGPNVRGTGHAIATTGISIRVRNVKPKLTRRKCRIASADVLLTLTYTYPRWRNSRRAPAKVRKEWDKFLARVVVHEKTHGRISKEFVRDLEKKILQISGRVSKGCSDFGKSSRRAIERLERRSQRRHVRFDRREGRASSRIRRLQARLVGSR